MLPLALLLAAAPPPEDGARFFEARVRPVLVARCFSCHSAEAGKARGGLRLDSRDALLRGGAAGPAVVPGKPAESLLVKAIEYADPDLEMPPSERLPDEEIAVLTRWVAEGAPWPAGAAAAPRREKAITDEDRAWWAYQPLRPPPVPAVPDRAWPRNEVDRFVLRALADAGLRPAPEADRATLVRRVTLDLHGLPPTAEEVAAFVADRRPDAYERLVDRLLASPRYGERWARAWLDLVRYAESDGHRQDAYRPHVWPYRDYVVRAFNEDRPFDRFVLEQLAGDELAPHDPSVLVATGFLRLGPYEWNQRDVPRQWNDILDEATDLVGDVFLGMGLACARCHDHKFDPILQRDYYRMRAFFAPLLWRDDRFLAAPDEEAAHRRAVAAWEQRTAALRAEIAEIERPHLLRAERSALAMFLPELQAMILKPAAERSPWEQQIAALAERQIAQARASIDDKIKGPERERWSALRRRLEAEEPPRPPPPAFVVSDVGPVAPPTALPGDPRPIEPGFPTVIDPRAVAITPPPDNPQSTGRRLALARWIASPENPLTARVIVNRVWQRRFGRGLVATASDFGRLGERPSHPALLDWLAVRFVDEGWRFKAIDRLLVTSAAYRQSARHPRPEAGRRVDPENRLLWRASPRRLDAEQVRDALLAASGELDPTLGGPSVEAARPRRALYLKALRNTPDPLLAAFDGVDGNASAPGRNVTTTASQALLLLNGPWALARAERLAERVRAAAGDDRQKQVQEAFRLVYARAATPRERRAARAFLGPAVPPAARAAVELPPDEVMPHRGGRAARIRRGHPGDWLRAPAPGAGGFALEAVVLLDSLDPGGGLRPLAAQGDAGGWAFGVAGGRGGAGTLALVREGELVSSDLAVELHRTYYLAFTVEEDGIVFHTKDLSDPDAPLRTARVRRQGPALLPGEPLLLGGRTGAAEGWDGLLDEVRIARRLAPAQLLVRDEPEPPAEVLAHYRFEPVPGFLADAAVPGRTLARAGGAAGGARPDQRLVDLCHALLNSNELLYVR